MESNAVILQQQSGHVLEDVTINLDLALGGRWVDHGLGKASG